jgi:hypothetical protein
MCYDDDEIIREVISQFPEEFGLCVYGGRFTINEDASFIDHHGEIQLWVFTVHGFGFSRGTPQELREEITL